LRSGVAQRSDRRPELTSIEPDWLAGVQAGNRDHVVHEEPSAASTVSELRWRRRPIAAPGQADVPATLAAPIGTTDSVRSSRLPVTAYSPESGKQRAQAAGCRGAVGSHSGRGGYRSEVGAAVGSGVDEARGAVCAPRLSARRRGRSRGVHAAPRARARQDSSASGPDDDSAASRPRSAQKLCHGGPPGPALADCCQRLSPRLTSRGDTAGMSTQASTPHLLRRIAVRPASAVAPSRRPPAAAFVSAALAATPA